MLMTFKKFSNEVLERRLTNKEITSVATSVGNYIDWVQVIEHAIYANIDK